jgi:hypothetical protein
MKRQPFALIASTLMIITCLPWLAHSQMLGGGGMGGMGEGDGMGGGPGMAGYGHGSNAPKEIIAYQQPTGPKPSWLTNGLASVEATETLRERLNLPVRVEMAQETLTDLPAFLQGQEVAIEVEFDVEGIVSEGLEIEVLRGLPAGEAPLRELLTRTLAPQGLAYRVLDHHIEITTEQIAIEKPVIRYYDLAQVQSDNRLLGQIIDAVQGTIQPDQWEINGGNGVLYPLGQLFVVGATESAHLEIERMLARLSQTMSKSPDPEGN